MGTLETRRTSALPPSEQLAQGGCKTHQAHVVGLVQRERDRREKKKSLAELLFPVGLGMGMEATKSDKPRSHPLRRKGICAQNR
jgi:hypothetical protein